jgi:hypothetical protein
MKKKLDNSHLIITEADKGSSLVIMQRQGKVKVKFSLCLTN